MSEARRPQEPQPPPEQPVWETECTFHDLVMKELAGLDYRKLGETGQAAGESCKPTIEEALLDRNLFGLALSGGGIRSSTFALGVIQKLAQLQLMSRLDYLSTVSGGGYLGSWLAAWIHRNCSMQDVERALIPPPEPDSPPKEAEQITWLRKYGKYLAPETSLFSADTWLIVALWMRNTTLNFAVLLLFLSAALMFPWFVVEGYAATATKVSLEIFLFVLHWVFLLSSAALAILGSRFNRNYRPAVGMLSAFLLCLSALMLTLTHWTTLDDLPPVWVQWFTGIYILLPLICMLFMVDFKRLSIGHLTFRIIVAGAINAGIALGVLHLLAGYDYWWRPIVLPGVIAATLCLKLTVIIGMAGPHMPDERREWWSRVAAWMCIIGMIWFGLPSLALSGPVIFDFLRQSTVLSIAFGGLWAGATAVGIFLGKSSSSHGKSKDAADPIKEIILPVLPLVFVFGLLVLLAAGLSHTVLNRSESQANYQAIIEGTTAELQQNNGAEKKDWKDIPYAQILSTDWQVFNDEVGMLYKSEVAGTLKSWHPYQLITLFLFGYLLMSRLIDINEFSMHRFYRNRLARGFQGAARDGLAKDGTRLRKADPFTNLDAKDDVLMSHLQPEGHPEVINGKATGEIIDSYNGPMHLVNTAININLADTGLEERRASSFVFSPYGCGYSVGSDEKGHYQLYPPDCDLRLGTPVTASGAAASPNMGYHTSGPVAFLLTVFNVRLGYWMFNTKGAKVSLSAWAFGKGVAATDKASRIPKWLSRKLLSSSVWTPEGPKIGTVYFISELFGMASDDRKYVYLSDGGHFENMAVYELLRRRCRFIICVDGEQDEDMKFEGLAGLIRRARADLGCEIRIDTSDIEQRTKEEGWSKSHCAVGTIRYKEAPDDGKHNSYLLYIKLSVTGDEPTDIINYRKTNPAFPHQSTGDQFFNESQFESYRRLGWHAADRTMRSVSSLLKEPEPDLLKVFPKLRDAWYGVPRKISDNFTKHTDTLNELMDELRTDPALSSLHPQLNRLGTWGEILPIPTEQQTVGCFYFCQKLIQFMETVFFDLDLESHYNHPACRGWIERFYDWASSRTLQLTYDQTEHTYSTQFRSFFQRLKEKSLVSD